MKIIDNIINKVDAFIELARAINEGNNDKANILNKIINRSIDEDIKNKEFTSNIKLTVDEKVEMLRKAGLNVKVLDKNAPYEEGYILGKMKDSHRVTEL